MALSWPRCQLTRPATSPCLVVTLIAAALLLGTGGAPWMAVVSSILVSLVADHLLSRHVLTDLGGGRAQR